MRQALFSSTGESVTLGRELGRGGEGAVYEVPSVPGQVAKIYLKPPDRKKQAKLAFMAAQADSRLLAVAAWPQATLHPRRGGDIVGFLMPNVAGRDPVHMIYSPAHRRQSRPRATWEFLLWVARNTAAAFETVHGQGYVLGDVNQGNVLAGNDSKAVLIDADSIQVNTGATLHLCEVGVSHFTPPELQGKTAFDAFARSPNHDNFGLALLIFHLLFGGRHPYSGVPLAQGVGDSLESDIARMHYAYARDARSRGTSRPPKSIPLTLVPDAMEAMFHAAFTETGASGYRPSAAQWVQALDGQRKRLKKCSNSDAHVFPDHLGRCPWCVMEEHSVIYFIDLGAAASSMGNGFVLVKAWALIEAIHAPPVIAIPDVEAIQTSPRSLPSGIPSKHAIDACQIASITIGILVCFIGGWAWLIGLGVAVFGFQWASKWGADERMAEARKRSEALKTAQQRWETLRSQASTGDGRADFDKKRSELSALRAEHQSLDDKLAKELSQLQSTAEARQREAFLNQCFIESADIPGVGSGRKANLRSFGIETAADVSRSRVQQVKGFGENLTRAVVDWRRRCERQFRFDPNRAVTEADQNAVRGRFASRKRQIEALLQAGPGELQRLRTKAATSASALGQPLSDAAFTLSQALADIKLSRWK